MAERSSNVFLDAAHRTLGFSEGSLITASGSPETHPSEVWIKKGEWLSLAEQVGAESVFFVENDPVIVFYSLLGDQSKTESDVFREVWCMSRPQCLFLATPVELKVFSLNTSPVRSEKDWQNVEPLAVVRSVAEVSEALKEFRRERVETGEVFSSLKFGDLDKRADKSLVLDLKAIRKELLALDESVPARHIHALIGRSIFVRYLEDRGVLTRTYFKDVAVKRDNEQWLNLLNPLRNSPRSSGIG